MKLDELLQQYPRIDTERIDELLNKEIQVNQHKLIVLDDDPTGVQTIHDLSVFTDWSKESIEEGFLEDKKAFFILTNSRGLSVQQTYELHTTIKENVKEVADKLGRNYIMISRSDSTLRGHYPLETSLLNDSYDGEILCPFFLEGGRYTVNNIHYVLQNDELIEAAQTEFAKDKTFGYSHSNLCEYIEEKTAGQYLASSVTCIQLDDLRNQNYDKILQQLMDVTNFNKVVVNAIDYCDLKVFAIALYRSLKQGKRFIFRCAAGLVKVLAGVNDQLLLTKNQMITKKTKNGGIVVVGSHTLKTTEQLNQLLTLKNVVRIAFDSDSILLGSYAFQKEIERCVTLEEKIIQSGNTAVCYTKRALLTLENDTKEEALQRSVAISDGVQRLVADLTIEPAFVIAKGGITSSDVGTKALHVKKANVLGQILPSVPVWQTGSESKYPTIPYVIFPGNTGNPDSLKKAVEILTAK